MKILFLVLLIAICIIFLHFNNIYIENLENENNDKKESFWEKIKEFFGFSSKKEEKKQDKKDDKKEENKIQNTTPSTSINSLPKTTKSTDTSSGTSSSGSSSSGTNTIDINNLTNEQIDDFYKKILYKDLHLPDFELNYPTDDENIEIFKNKKDDLIITSLYGLSINNMKKRAKELKNNNKTVSCSQM